MTATDRDPVTLARTILYSLDGETDAETVHALVSDLRTLAHAVDAVAKLADRLDVIANELEADGEDGYADAARTDAHSIRAALKGAAA